MEIPTNRDAEDAVIAALLIDRNAQHEVMDSLSPADFYAEENRTIFGGIELLYRRGVKPDIITVCNELDSRSLLKKAGGASGVSRRIDMLPDVGSVKAYAGIVKNVAAARKLQAICISTASKCSNPEDTSQILSGLQGDLGEVYRDAQQREAVHISGPAEEMHRSLEMIRDGEVEKLGLRSGIEIIDKKFGILAPKNVYVVAGGVSAGKSSLVDQIADNVAKKGKTTMIFALEMSIVQRAQRFVCRRARVDIGAFQNPKYLSEEVMVNLKHTIEALKEPPIYVDDDRTITPRDMMARASRFQNQHGLDLVIVDYLQLVKPMSKAPREQQIAEISSEMNVMAGELAVPVLAVTQLSRLHQSEGRKPEMRDIRESGRIEQDAFGIVAVYRPAIEEQECEMGVLKNRQGSIGWGRALFHGPHFRFTPWAPEEWRGL